MELEFGRRRVRSGVLKLDEPHLLVAVLVRVGTARTNRFDLVDTLAHPQTAPSETTCIRRSRTIRRASRHAAFWSSHPFTAEASSSTSGAWKWMRFAAS